MWDFEKQDFLGVDKMDKIKILIAAHKQYDMPRDAMYLPVSAGAFKRTDNWGYACDNDSTKPRGHISEKNPTYNELSVLYYGWKNVAAEYLGLVHYRRHFSESKNSQYSTIQEYLDQILTEEQIAKYIDKYDLILPKKRHYYILSLKDHFLQANPDLVDQYEMFRAVLKDRSDETLQAFDRVMNRRSAHMFNVFIMKRQYLDQYCEWIFDILFEYEERIKEQGLSERRLYGLMCEYMIDTWLELNPIPYHEMKVINFEEISMWQKAKKIVGRIIRSKK